MSKKERLCHNERQTAEMLGVSVKTLQASRWQNRGPKYLKLGRRVSDTSKDIDEFININLVETRPQS